MTRGIEASGGIEEEMTHNMSEFAISQKTYVTHPIASGLLVIIVQLQLDRIGSVTSFRQRRTNGSRTFQIVELERMSTRLTQGST